ncbi:MAG: NADPH-dependent F420 reductase [Alphaproteobacteria bacterium]|nr:MAG: NADPH-dependent F420 reductase [Alphaproteobacteria bacterium]
MAVVGGTGALGIGLVRRLARAGHAVTIGSRSAEKAEALARETNVALGSDLVRGATNADAARSAAIVFVTVPFSSQSEILAEIRSGVRDKVVVDATVPLVPPRVARVQLPAEGSAAVIAQQILGDEVTVVSAFHNVSAHKLGQEGDVDCDVLVFGDVDEACERVVAIIDGLGLRGLRGGPLANSAAAEAMTSVLISINRRYKVAGGAGICISGALSRQTG